MLGQNTSGEVMRPHSWFCGLESEHAVIYRPLMANGMQLPDVSLVFDPDLVLHADHLQVRCVISSPYPSPGPGLMQAATETTGHMLHSCWGSHLVHNCIQVVLEFGRFQSQPGAEHEGLTDGGLHQQILVMLCHSLLRKLEAV